ncbi:hypothetical protein CYY_006403, partial [Polysphondylium violaceum]
LGVPEAYSTILIEGGRLAGLALINKNTSMPIYSLLKPMNVLVRMKLFSNSKAKLKTSDDPPRIPPATTSPAADTAPATATDNPSVTTTPAIGSTATSTTTTSKTHTSSNFLPVNKIVKYW